MTYRVLSLDGGGIRGLLTSRLLERLEEERPGFLDGVDLFAGTSTGGILALALAAGLEPQAISALYRVRGPAIFADDTIFDALAHADRLVIADYRNDELREALTDTFGDMRLGELRKRVVVSTFDLDSGAVTKAGMRSWKPKFFHNYPEDSDDRDQLVVDVALRTSAAPTFFPTWQGYVDGGVAANNPSMCALAQALDPNTGKQHLDDVRLLSIGTGGCPQRIEGDHDWGLAQWAPKLLGIVFDGVAGVADFQCRQVLGEHYHRLDVVLDEPGIGLDDCDAIPELERRAEAADITAAVAWLGTHVRPRT